MKRDISVSTGAYDGYAMPDILASMHRLGIKKVELAFIKGYVNEFTDADLNVGYAQELVGLMDSLGQQCPTFSGHINLGDDTALSQFEVRARFAAELGAKRLITNAATRETAARFFQLAPEMAAIAKAHDIIVCLENPGDRVDNILNSAKDIQPLLSRLGSDAFGINYDVGNLISHCPDLDPVEDTRLALPYSAHLHIKDAYYRNHVYHFCALGEGAIAFDTLLPHIAEDFSALSFSLELPFRLQRNDDAKPYKKPDLLTMPEIEDDLATSIAYLNKTMNLKE
ncbi:sugar phosphate isomerase/epimerase (plasmid) [Photobacterium sp. GJ3]|uniref:sugar phosphate isomerase/epimerase family protein n=1 Tax=Photobacterium sp. GJ3 TaxID=2829502 RepID=UPI001B8C6A86|nr:sugar phosphate isomerase/epimerase family protein [Photobacterium sp. GJ3]QUJ69688.1 sugar phosphate isomerase/epimerase [Photobacterium sp. GJ3]